MLFIQIGVTVRGHYKGGWKGAVIADKTNMLLILNAQSVVTGWFKLVVLGTGRHNAAVACSK